ncbi:hypothetical protein J6590_035139 [Homalodisca vitripennis]|nr:hypothetical protein J6590_035139 [Homalodisca vitripennis]
MYLHLGRILIPLDALKIFNRIVNECPKWIVGNVNSHSDARDIRQLHIFWNYRKPYNRTNPYSTTDFTNVTFNENSARTITVADNDIQLHIGDSIFYWLLLITKEWERITLHKQNFWVKFDQKVWDGVPEPFSETYYRDFDKYHLNDEM